MFATLTLVAQVPQQSRPRDGAPAHVRLGSLAIPTKAVVRNVSSTQTVPESKPVLKTNVWIPALEPAASMPSVESSTTSLHAVVLQDTTEMHSKSALKYVSMFF